MLLKHSPKDVPPESAHCMHVKGMMITEKRKHDKLGGRSYIDHPYSQWPCQRFGRNVIFSQQSKNLSIFAPPPVMVL